MPHTNNWAVLVCTSTFWFNYRHVANVLSVYHIIKRLGIPDDHIIMMLADDMACNYRNSFPATVYNHYDHDLNVYGADVEVDYRGSEVTVDNFLRLLTNRLPVDTPRSKRLATDERSNVLIYMTGHGGDNFLKFQDQEEINARDLADALSQMHERRSEVLLMIDTCQASTMHDHIIAPGVTAIASSYQVDDQLGVAVLDRFTWALLEFTKAVNSTSSVTIQDLFSSLDPKFLSSTPDIKQSDWTSLPTESKVVDFMGNVRTVVVAVEPVFLNNNKSEFAFAPNRFTLDQDSLFPLERGLLDAPSREYFFIQKGSSLMGCGLISSATGLLFGCLPWSKSRGSRYMNAVIFFLFSGLVFSTPSWSGWVARIAPIKGIDCDEYCYNHYTVYRMGFAFALYHIVQAILLIGVEDGENPRAIIQDGFWPAKVILLFALLIGSFFVPYKIFNVLFYLAILLGFMFILIQGVLLIDLAFDWTEAMLEKASEGNSFFQYLLIGSTVALNTIALAVIVSVYVYFDHDLERTLMTISALILILMTICSALPIVQEATPSSGIFQSALLGVFSLLILLSAFISNSHLPRFANAVLAINIVYAYLAVAQATFSTTSSVSRLTNDKQDEPITGTDDDDAAHYNHTLFHCTFAFAAIYTILYATFWQYADTSGTIVKIVDSLLGFWVRVSASWLVGGLYVWALFAPILLDDRMF